MKKTPDETLFDRPLETSKEALRKKRRADKIMQQAIELADEEAQQAGSLTFSPRCILLATLPHRDPGNIPVFIRRNGHYTLRIEAGYRFLGEEERTSNAPQVVPLGYPFGVIPRLMIAWITTEAVRTQSKTIYLGDSLADFLRQLDLGRHGGPRGDITRLRDQMDRLFASRLSFFYPGVGRHDIHYLQLIHKSSYFWESAPRPGVDPKSASIVLTHEFFREIVERPVPLDWRVMHALKHSSLALDIYAWLTYRMSYLKKPTTIPWASLVLQFGSDYTRLRDFKINFLEQLKAVKLLYCHARFSTEDDKGLTLYPSRPQVLKADQVP